MWMMSCTGSARGGFWGFWKKSVSWVLRSEEEGWLLLACSGLVAGATRVRGGGADGKASIKRLCLSPYVEKPFNSKVIKKGFVTELRSRKCFCVSGFLCSMYICYEHSMYVLHIRKWRLGWTFNWVAWLCWSPSPIHRLLYWVIRRLKYILIVVWENWVSVNSLILKSEVSCALSSMLQVSSLPDACFDKVQYTLV